MVPGPLPYPYCKYERENQAHWETPSRCLTLLTTNGIHSRLPPKLSNRIGATSPACPRKN